MAARQAIGWVSAAGLAAACLLWAETGGGVVWVTLAVWMLGLAMAVAAAVGMVDWVAGLAIRRLVELRRALTVTERVVLLERISRMDAEQLEFARQYAPRVEMASGDAGPALFLRVIGDTIPMNFVEAFLDESDEQFLKPVRDFSEGSIERRWAEAFTAWCVWMGYAAEAGGNRPARWIERERALRALGLK